MLPKSPEEIAQLLEEYSRLTNDPKIAADEARLRRRQRPIVPTNGPRRHELKEPQLPFFRRQPINIGDQ